MTEAAATAAVTPSRMNSVLRRRGILEPLPAASTTASTTTSTTTTGEAFPHRELQIGSALEDDDSPFNIVYVSPCQVKVSNDPLNPLLFVDDIIPCNITLYDCYGDGDLDNLNTSTTVPQPYKLVVNYDYELHYASNADLDETIDVLEGSMLQHVASITGLDDCPTFTQRRRRFLQDALGTSQEEALLGISSSPADEVDPDFADCIVPVASSDVQGTICQPLKGSMVAYLHQDTAPSVEDSLNNVILRIIRDGMVNDVYVSGDARKVSFIGTRADGLPSDLASNRGTAGLQTDDGTGLTTIGITFIAVGAVLAFVICALFAMRRQQQRENRKLEFQNDEDIEFHDATISPNVPSSLGSLAVMDTLALAPTPASLKEEDEEEGKEEEEDVEETMKEVAAAATSQAAAAAATSMAVNSMQHSTSYDRGVTTDESFDTAHEVLNRSGDSDVLAPPIDNKFTGSDFSSGSPTSSLDGAEEGDIIHRLNSMSEVREEPLTEGDEDDDEEEDQNYRLRRIT